MARRHGDDEDVQALVEDLLRQAAAMREHWTRVAEAAGIELPAARGPEDTVFPSAPENDTLRMRLVGLDMMLAGASRDDIAAHLRSTFGGDDVEPVLDDLFQQYE